MKINILKNLCKNNGFTLLEILISISLLSVIFVAAVSYVTTTLRLAQVNQHYIMAIHYNEEVLEWLDVEQETNWDDFIDKIDNASQTSTYCFNNKLLYGNNWPTKGSCADFNGITGISPAIFKRELTMTKYGSPATRVKATITTSWKELGKNYEITHNRIFSLYKN
jgi:prepilin-type N-terminal cleavage/methylation domain-containing protein